MDLSREELMHPTYSPSSASANIHSEAIGRVQVPWIEEPTRFVDGTGTNWSISRAREWAKMLEARIPLFHIEPRWGNDNARQHSDLRSASQHLANIRAVLNLAISDLAGVLGVSRQAIYKWIREETTPEREKFDRIVVLSHVADDLREANIKHISSLLKMKMFEGRSLLDLAASNGLYSSHVRKLVEEARQMAAAYERSGLATSKAKPTEDWRTEWSIPGSPE